MEWNRVEKMLKEQVGVGWMSGSKENGRWMQHTKKALKRLKVLRRQTDVNETKAAASEERILRKEKAESDNLLH